MKRQPFQLAITALLLAASVPISGCQDYPFVYRPNQRVAITQVREVIVQDSNTDILFVIDNSGSMAEEQANLVRNTAVFIEELAASDNEYRVGIVTMDARNQGSSGLDGGMLRMQRATQAELDAASCGIGPSTGTLPYLERPPLGDPQEDAKRCRLVQDFVATVASLGIQGGGLEAGLLAAEIALSTDQGTSPTRLLRDSADLALIFLTDEDDCSLSDYGEDPWHNSRCYEEIANMLPIEDYVASYAALKGEAGVRKVRAALIAGGAQEGLEGGGFIPKGCRLTPEGASDDCGCWSSTDQDFFCEYLNGYGHVCDASTGCRGTGGPGDMCSSTGQTCDMTRCDALPGTRYFDFMRALRKERLDVGFSGGTFSDSICQPEYDQTLLTIARTVVLSDCFELEVPAADEGQINVNFKRIGIDGTTATTVLPRFGTDADADCNDCGACSSGAWRLADTRTICLECGLRKQTGDSFTLSILNEVLGVDPTSGDTP
jgi:hypothetical protein